MAEKREVIEGVAKKGNVIYSVYIEPDRVEAARQERPLGLSYGNHVTSVYRISLPSGETQHYVFHDGWAYRGSLTGCSIEGEGFLEREKVNDILNAVRELLSTGEKEKVIEAYVKVKKAVVESFSDIEEED